MLVLLFLSDLLQMKKHQELLSGIQASSRMEFHG